MARARNIKPSLFTNEILGTLDPLVTILFCGLWCLADKDGILEDRPLRIKAEVFPYREKVDVNRYLTVMEHHGFIQRYVYDGKGYIFVTAFLKHQSPHHTEKAKDFPKPPQRSSGEQSLTPLSDGEYQVSTRSDSLIPDSGFIDSLIPDSLIPDSKKQTESKPLPSASRPVKEKKVVTEDETALQRVCHQTWGEYVLAYQDRYGVPPVRNTKVSSQVKQFCQRVSATEAPAIAAFYVTHNAGFYVSNGHSVGLMLKDAEKLRTEWATNQTVTQSQARQVDATAGRGNVWKKVIAEITERERNEQTIQNAQ